MQPEQIEVNGIPVSYVDDGRGEPVVFVHGAVADLRVWEPIRESVANQHRFVAPTLRYFGNRRMAGQRRSVQRRHPCR